MPKDNATVKQRLFYPFAPNFDNSIISKENVTFIVFCWGATFDYFEFDRQNTSWKLPNQQQLTIQDDQVYLEQEQLQLNKLINCQDLVLIVKRYQDLVIKTTNLPNTAITISNQRAAPLSGLNQMAGQEILMLPSSNKKQESSFEYDLGKINAATKTYFNDQLVKTQLAGKFEVGDSFFVNGLYIEMNPQQFKITEVFGKLWLDERYFIEETFKPLVPIDFPEYTRSPRIRLAQPDDKVPVNNPKPADRKPSNLLRMLIPSLGMLAASVLMTFVSGMNLYMMMGMGSMSLITVLMTLYLGHSDKKKFKKDQKDFKNAYKFTRNCINHFNLWGKEAVSGGKIAINSEIVAEMSHDASEIKEQLTQIKHANDTIIPEMDKALREVKEKFVNMFPVDMSSVIEETISENRLRPHQYADLGAIHEVDHEIMHNEVNLGQLERAVHRTVIDEQQTDSEWSRKFHL